MGHRNFGFPRNEKGNRHDCVMSESCKDVMKNLSLRKKRLRKVGIERVDESEDSIEIL